MLSRTLFFFILTLSILMVVSSCNHDHQEPLVNQVPVSFTLSIADQETSTRAANNRWEAGDKVGIYMVDYGTTQLPGLTEGNHPYVTTVSGEAADLMAEGSALSYPSDNSEVNFIAYYPYLSDLHTTLNHIYPVNIAQHDAGTQEQLTTEVDLLYHKGTTPYKQKDRTASLSFTHQLTKLNIRLYPAQDITMDITGALVTLSGIPTTARFDLSTEVLDNPTGTDVTVKAKKQAVTGGVNESLFETILVPHEGKEYTNRILTFTIGSESYSVSLPGSRNFDEGTAYLYSFKFTGTAVVLIQSTKMEWDGGTIAWGDYLLTSTKTYFDLPAISSTGNTVTFSTNAPARPTFALSEEANSNTTATPNWIAGATLSDGTPTPEGWTEYALTFGVSPNIESVGRTGYIRLEIEGLCLPVRVTQAQGVGEYVNDPEPASFTNIIAAGKTGNTFTIKTNMPDTDIAVTTDNGSMLANLTKIRGAIENDGSSTWTIGFDVAKNTALARNANINVTIGGIRKIVPISQEGGFTPQNSNTNCYMVAPGSQTIYIPVTRAINNDMLSTAPFTAVKLWDDNSVVASVGTEGSGSSGYITVTVNSASRQGNALVAVRSGSTIYWSWHIWVTTYNPNPSTTSNSWTYYNGSSDYIFMDRNLGATDNTFSVASRGLFYQWGRKDPFPATDDVQGFMKVSGPVSLEVANRNPDKFYCNSNNPYNWLSSQVDDLWGHNTTKSVYDPCPEGWRVPSWKNNLSPWNGLNLSNFTWESSSGTGRQYESETTSRYPAAGHRLGGTGSLAYVGIGGNYWSGTLGCILGIDITSVNPNNPTYRSYGLSVRCSSE